MEKSDLIALWASIRHDLEKALPEIRTLIEAQFAQAGTLEPDSPLAQNGLQDGANVVIEYIAANELGLALEHLCYMVFEAHLPISSETYDALVSAGRKMDVDQDLAGYPSWIVLTAGSGG